MARVAAPQARVERWPNSGERHTRGRYRCDHKMSQLSPPRGDGGCAQSWFILFASTTAYDMKRHTIMCRTPGRVCPGEVDACPDPHAGGYQRHLRPVARFWVAGSTVGGAPALTLHGMTRPLLGYVIGTGARARDTGARLQRFLDCARGDPVGDSEKYRFPRVICGESLEHGHAYQALSGLVPTPAAGMNHSRRPSRETGGVVDGPPVTA